MTTYKTRKAAARDAAIMAQRPAYIEAHRLRGCTVSDLLHQNSPTR